VFVGQNMGAKQLDRIRESVRKTFFVQLCYHTVTGFILLLFGKSFIRIFVSDGASAMINIGYTYLIFAAVGGLGNAVRALMLSALIGAGDSEAAFRASIVQLAVQVFCAFVLSRYLGYVGVFLGTPLGWAASGIYGLIRYHSGKWEEKGVV
jgi:Na+-driven multidrug efflux pump